MPVLFALRKLAAAKYSRPLLSYSDRACVGRNNLAADTDKHAEHITAFGSSLLPGACFCGRLCPAGAFTEYLSKLVPSKFQISWHRYTEIAPIRYGMLAGFCLVPFFGGILACSYCNFFLFDLLANYYMQGYFISLTSSLLLTAIMWVLVFGIFTKGGRGFCNFLCPVGAAQGLMHAIGCKLPFVLRMRVDKNQCIGCGLCAKKCPMESAELAEGKAQINQHNCICCGVCQHACPVQAISYGRKRV